MQLMEFLNQYKIKLPDQCVNYLAKHSRSLPPIDDTVPAKEAVDNYRLPAIPIHFAESDVERAMEWANDKIAQMRLIGKLRIHFGLMDDPDAVPPSEYKCKVCYDTGWAAVSPDDQDGYGRYGKCDCNLVDIKRSGIQERFYSGWAGFDVGPQNLEAYNSLRALVSSTGSIWDMIRNGKGIYIWGNTGSGKTHLVSSGILSVIRHTKGKVSTCIVDANSMLWELSPEQGVEDELITKLSTVQILCLDDLGAEIPSAFKLGKLRLILNNRNAKMLPIWVTSNLSPSELYQRFSIADEVTAKQIADRLGTSKICYVKKRG